MGCDIIISRGAKQRLTFLKQNNPNLTKAVQVHPFNRHQGTLQTIKFIHNFWCFWSMPKLWQRQIYTKHCFTYTTNVGNGKDTQSKQFTPKLTRVWWLEYILNHKLSCLVKLTRCLVTYKHHRRRLNYYCKILLWGEGDRLRGNLIRYYICPWMCERNLELDWMRIGINNIVC